MAISSSITRLADYYTRHGFGATVRRAGLAVRRALFSSRMVVFYCDLEKVTSTPVHLPSPLRIERLAGLSDLSEQDLQDIVSFWNPKQANRNIRERFEKKSSLWLIKSGDKLAGYGWTLKGRTIEPHFFPMAQDDVHLFDFHVFPQFRGQGLNPLLVTHILSNLAETMGGRAFIEAAEWNEAQLSSLRKTPFRLLGRVRTLKIASRTFVSWVEGESIGAKQEEADPGDRMKVKAKPNV